MAALLRKFILVCVWGTCLCTACPGVACPAPGVPDIQAVRELLAAGRYLEAEAAARGLLAEVQRQDRPDSLSIADLLDLLVTSMRRSGKAGDPEARRLAEDAVRIRERALGPEDRSYAGSLHNLGLLLYANQDYAGALPLLERVFRIREAALGPSDLDVAASLLAIGAVRNDMGERSVARPLLERALTIREAALGPDHEDVGECLNALAVLHYLDGDYALARSMYERTHRIWSKALGPDHAKLATCLHNLGTLELEIADFGNARVHLEEALRIRRKALGPRHELVAGTLTSLAFAWRAAGELQRSRTLYEEALAIQRQRFGEDHHGVAWTLARVGFLLTHQERYREAKSYLTKAVSGLERALGSDHPQVGEALVGLATVTSALGDSAGANRLFERALQIQVKALGPNHPELAVTLDELARSLARSRDLEGALTHSLRAEEIRREHLRTAAHGLSEERVLALASYRIPSYSAPRTTSLRFALSCLARDSARTPHHVARAWDATIRSRALVLDEVAVRNRTVGEMSRRAAAFEAARQRLANLLVRGPAEGNAERYPALISAARADAEEAERALAERAAAFRAGPLRAQVGWAEVLSSLPPGSALLAYAVGGDPKEELYIAFAVRSGERTPTVVVLGSAGEIDALVSRWEREAVRSALGSQSPRQAEDAYRATGSNLRLRIWEPLAPCFQGIDRVFIVPDGSLSLVNFAALPTGTGDYLIEKGPLVHYLSAERDLVPAPLAGGSGDGLLAVGGPDFDQPPADGHDRAGAPGEAVATRENYRGSRPDCDEFRAVRFEPLPDARREANEIDSLWASSGDAVVLTGADATELAVRRLAVGRRVLHLATHGFFLTGRCASGNVGKRGIGGLSTEGATQDPRPARDLAQSPLRLSGLALAGANRRNSVGLNEQDGILMAEEISSMDLAGVEWVVLSGCETGVGEVQVGEGVLGLRRAFRAAGAGTLIMSLWPVEDSAARRWMNLLYEGRLREKLGTAEAVRRASQRVLEERRAQALSTHPFYWAAFVAAGDWR